MPLWQPTLGGDGILEGKKPLDICLNPENQLCPLFDAVSIKQWPVAEPGEMGVRVLDDCCQAHIM